MSFGFGLLALSVLALDNFGPRQWCPQTLPSPMLTPFVWHRLRWQLGGVLLQIHWRQWYSKHDGHPKIWLLFCLLWLWVFVFLALALALGFGFGVLFLAFYLACFFLKWPCIFVAACSMSLSGFRNSSPISWFFSPSLSYPFLAGLLLFFSFFAFYLACFFLKWPWILVAACSMSLSGFRNSSPIS